MPRKGKISRRRIEADSMFNDVLVTKFINCLMQDGKKSKAEKVFYGALNKVNEQTGKNSLDAFHEAIDKVKPSLEVRPRRVGGATYQVPMEVVPFRKQSLAIRWLINAAKSRSEKSMLERLSSEIIDVINDRGGAIKKKEDTRRMAEANRAFAHYRW